MSKQCLQQSTCIKIAIARYNQHASDLGFNPEVETRCWNSTTTNVTYVLSMILAATCDVDRCCCSTIHMRQAAVHSLHLSAEVDHRI